MFAVAPHAAIGGLESWLVKNAGDEIALVVVAAIEFRAVDRVEMALKIEMAQNGLGEHHGLRGAEK